MSARAAANGTAEVASAHLTSLGAVTALILQILLALACAAGSKLGTSDTTLPLMTVALRIARGGYGREHGAASGGTGGAHSAMEGGTI